MARELGQLRVIAKPQREHVAVASDNDGFPPAVFQCFLSDDEVARRNRVPGLGQASCYRQLVVVFADGGLRLGRELHDDLAVQVLPDVRHKALAVRVQLLGYDEDQKPRAAQFLAADANLVAKAQIPAMS